MQGGTTRGARHAGFPTTLVRLVAGRPRLLILITLAEVGGAQTYVANLLPGLVEEWDVTVAASGPGPLRAVVEGAGAIYVALEHVRRPIAPAEDLRGLVELVRLCRRVRPHIVHANSSKAGILGRIAARIAGVPSRVFTVHGWAFAAYPGRTGTLYLWAERLLRPLTTRTICVAENERRLGFAARTCTPERTSVIHNAVDVAATAVATPDTAAPRLVSVGRLKYPKDFRTLVEAIALLGGRELLLEIVGEGPDRDELQALIDRLGLGSRVVLGGQRDDVPALLARSSAFVLSSVSEGLPISVIEAMAAGLPVVASDVGGVGELVADGETGFLIPPGDAQALADALAELLDEPLLRRDLGAAGRRRAEALFDLHAFREAHLRLFREELAHA